MALPKQVQTVLFLILVTFSKLSALDSSKLRFCYLLLLLLLLLLFLATLFLFISLSKLV